MRDTIKNEFLVGYKKKMPCKLVTFIDHVTRAHEKQVFVMEAVEKCNVDTVIDSKSDFGLVEIKKGRSKDILLKTGDVIQMHIDGQMRPTETRLDEYNNLCYIQGLPNVIHVATEIKRDPEKLPDAMIIYRRQPNNIVVHSIALMTRDLSELPTGIFIRLQIFSVVFMKVTKIGSFVFSRLAYGSDLLSVTDKLTVRCLVCVSPSG